MHKIRSLTIVLTMVVGVFVTESTGKRTEKHLSDLQKNFQRIDKHLEENVKSNNVETNLAEIENYLHKESSKITILKDKSLVEALRLITSLAESFETSSCESSVIEIMTLADEALATKTRLTLANYPSSRVEDLIQYYSYKKAAQCRGIFLREELRFGYKQLAYDKLNEQMFEFLPKSNDFEADLEAAAEKLTDLGPLDGAMSSALKQLLELRSTLQEESCNGEQGFEAVLKNDLASRFVVNLFTPSRRIDKITKYYSIEHAKMCRPVFRSKIRNELKQLDDFTFRTVLALVSYNYLGPAQISDVRASVNQKRASDGDFTIPQMVEYATFEAKSLLALHGLEDYNPKLLHQHIVSVAGGDRKMEQFMQLIERDKDWSMIHLLYLKYLHKPCREYLSSPLGSLFEANEYGELVLAANGYSNSKGDFIPNLDYFMARAGYQVCQLIINKHEHLISRLKDVWLNK